jgi:DNA transformation protein
VSVRWLEAAGITSVADLRRIGAVAAYGRVSFQQGKQVSLNLLYALHAALKGVRWDEVTTAEKRRLRREAGLEDREPL